MNSFWKKPVANRQVGEMNRKRRIEQEGIEVPLNKPYK
jgi:hypothetical protein